jgi:hypothetical protein
MPETPLIGSIIFVFCVNVNLCEREYIIVRITCLVSAYLHLKMAMFRHASYDILAESRLMIGALVRYKTMENGAGQSSYAVPC